MVNHSNSISISADPFFLAALGLICSMQDLVPWLGIEPRPPALGVWSLSHWTTSEVCSADSILINKNCVKICLLSNLALLHSIPVVHLVAFYRLSKNSAICSYFLLCHWSPVSCFSSQQCLGLVISLHDVCVCVCVFVYACVCVPHSLYILWMFCLTGKQLWIFYWSSSS